MILRLEETIEPAIIYLLGGLGLIAGATLDDIRTREIRDGWALALGTIALLAAFFGWAGMRWWMVGAGALTGFVSGWLLFRFAGFGGGDAKLLMGIGAVVGPVALVFVLFWMALAGGVLALVAMRRGKRAYAYGPAILAGYTGYLIWPAEIWRL